MGIDIIVQNKGFYYAVQCKYKKNKTIRKNILSWRNLSTFYALCLKTGPYEKYIVMTTCEYVTHHVSKSENDVSICIKSFQNITKDEWLSMCNINGNKINDIKKENTMNLSTHLCVDRELISTDDAKKNTMNLSTHLYVDKDTLRKKRLEFYNK